MARYGIGDLQGCKASLDRLLERIEFRPGTDHLWLVGDLVNRGPRSLDVLRWARDLGDAATVVLGNHDLHLLARAAGVAAAKKRDTLDEGAVLSSGIGPWLPFQMLALGWMGAGAGLIGRVTVRLGREVEVVVLAAYGWVWGFVFGAVMNLWFWPFVRDGSDLSWEPGMGLGQTLHHYWSFYVATSFAWDAAGAFANAVIIVVVGRSLLTTLRRHAHRLDPVTVLETADEVPEPV